MKSYLRACACAVGLLLTGLPAFPQASATAPAKTSKAAKSGGKVAPASAIDLNTASESELQTVPGIGAPTAKKIVAGRPYSSVSDLSKAGISAASIKRISPMVKVGGGASVPAAAAPATSSQAAAPQTSVQPAAQPTAAPAARSSRKTAGAPSEPAANAAPGGGPGMVWVNTETKVFHESGDRWYGRTKQGKYMKESDAVAAGYRAAKQKK